MTEHSTSANPPTSSAAPANEILGAIAAFTETRFRSSAEASQAALAMIAPLVGVRSAFVSRLDSQVMFLLDVWEDAGCGFEAGSATPIEMTFCQIVRATSEPLIVEDAANDARVRDLPTRTMFGIGAYLGVPITLDGGEVFGTVCLLDPEPRRFSADHVAALSILSSHVAFAIEREAARNAMLRIEQDAMHDLTAALSSIEQQSLSVRTIGNGMRESLAVLHTAAETLRYGRPDSPNPDEQAVLDRMQQALSVLNRLTDDLHKASTP